MLNGSCVIHGMMKICVNCRRLKLERQLLALERPWSQRNVILSVLSDHRQLGQRLVQLRLDWLTKFVCTVNWRKVLKICVLNYFWIFLNHNRKNCDIWICQTYLTAWITWALASWWENWNDCWSGLWNAFTVLRWRESAACGWKDWIWSKWNSSWFRITWVTVTTASWCWIRGNYWLSWATRNNFFGIAFREFWISSRINGLCDNSWIHLVRWTFTVTAVGFRTTATNWNNNWSNTSWLLAWWWRMELWWCTWSTTTNYHWNCSSFICLQFKKKKKQKFK